MVSYAPGEVVALIPARGGSKGIPRKNIKDFAGAPLIAWSIAAAKAAEGVTRVIVSTDDPEIAEVAKAWGAEVPFMRPADLALDETPDLPVFLHALDYLADSSGHLPEFMVQLRPTSPIRPKGLVDEALALLAAEPQADSVRGVVPSGQNPYKMWRVDPASGQMKPLMKLDGQPEPFNAPRQSLPATYWQTGHIDAIRTRCIVEKSSLSGDFILPLFIDPRYTVDIDSPADWPKYEALVREGGLDLVDPLTAGSRDSKKRPLPERVQLLALDFDGVLSDDMVYTDQDGRESVRTSRGDGMGIRLLIEQGLTEVMIISREVNPVVSARAKKLNLPVRQAVMDKAQALREVIAEGGYSPDAVVFVGNDLPDLAALPEVGCFICPADAIAEVRNMADLVLKRKGGRGAVRELCDRIRLAQAKLGV